ncbi:MAG: hypothetical protein ACJARN_000353 [Arenicella sp.]|jgi:hypothetical protein
MLAFCGCLDLRFIGYDYQHTESGDLIKNPAKLCSYRTIASVKSYPRINFSLLHSLCPIKSPIKI